MWYDLALETWLMFFAEGQLCVWLCTEPTDMRKSFDGNLIALACQPFLITREGRMRYTEFVKRMLQCGIIGLLVHDAILTK